VFPNLFKSIYSPRYTGPFEVLQINGATLTLKHTTSGKIIHRNEHHVKRTSGLNENASKQYVYDAPSVVQEEAETHPARNFSRRYPTRIHFEPQRFILSR